MDKGEQPPSQDASGPGNFLAGGGQNIGAVNQYFGSPSSQLIARPWHLPKPADKFFGRQSEISQVVELLRQHQQLALIGAGGVGKTALASEVIQRLAPRREEPGLFPSGIYSHDYYQLADHPAAISRILAQAGLHDVKDADRPGVVTRLLDQPGVLLYLEGCEKAENLSALLALASQAKVLLTTRDVDKSGNAHPHSVEPLDEVSAAELLSYHAGQTLLSTEETARRPWLALARRLGCHPLAMQLAGTWLLRRRVTPADFVVQLDADGFFFWDTKVEAKENLRTLFRHSAEAVVSKQPEALEVWYALALHGHAPVPLTTLAAILGFRVSRTEMLCERLQDLSLAKPDKFPCESGGAPVRAWQLVHSLLGEWGSDQLCSTDSDLPGRRKSESAVGRKDLLALKRAETIRNALLAWWASDLEVCFKQDLVPGGPERYAAVQPHWDAVLDISERMQASSAGDPVVFLTKLGNAHRSMGDITSAEVLYRRALSLSEQKLGREHLVAIGCLGNLANLLSEKGKKVEVEPMFRRVLTVRRREQGEVHPDTLSGMNNLALVLVDLGMLDEAIALHRQAIQGWKKADKKVQHHKNRSLNNLGISLKAKGKLASAEALFRLAAKEGIRDLGPEHPDTLSSLGNLANMLADRTQPIESEQIYRKILPIQERRLGVDHPDTLMTVCNLAVLIGEHGDLMEAEQLADRAERGFRDRYGTCHVHTVRAQRLLAQIREQRAK